MRSFLRNAVITGAAFLAVYWLTGLYSSSLRDPLFFDGWVLALGMALQLVFHIKKRRATGNSATTTWQQVHIYTGYFVVLVFALHTRLSLPDTGLETAMWLLFILVAVSGMIGTYLNSAIPLKLEQDPGSVVFERIRVAQSELAGKASNLALGSVGRVGSLAASELYASGLYDFFSAPKNIWAHLRGSRRPLKRLLFQIDNLETELGPEGQSTVQEIRDLVKSKDQLDYRYAHECALKGWLFVHIPATYALVGLSVLHVVIVYAFSSGVE